MAHIQLPEGMPGIVGPREMGEQLAHQGYTRDRFRKTPTTAQA